ncbi:hypothetical protein [Aromatoleum evansii]|uniref:hypothetical protein n=1 Tax=Aromatoleum evansii TaxID=59406 RepID=UPI00145DA31B|nr:hypothetical protein [Aromatoleum evansii]NMG28429.1 hypothetical protein [Aromatoleum evansii]
MSQKILFPGRYRLTKRFVGLAAEPSRFFEPGDEFTVTAIEPDGSVGLVFVPEFGGWTFYEVPARPIGRTRMRYVARDLIPYLGALVGVSGFGVYLADGADAMRYGLAVTTALYSAAVFYGTPMLARLLCRRKK